MSTQRTDPKDWTAPRFDRAVEDLVADLRRAADRVEQIGTRGLRGRTPYFSAASSIQHELRSLAGNLSVDSVYRAAFDVETITIESLERHAEEERKAEAAKTEQWFDGKEWHPVTAYNTRGTSRAHYFVHGAGDGDGSICGRVVYSSGIRNSPLKPVCQKCDRSKSRR